MRERLPRRYDATVKFLRETLVNEKIGHRVRMAAAMRLSEIMLEHDRAVTRKELAQERTAARQAEPQGSAQPREPEQPQLSPAEAEREARAFLERTRGKEPSTNVE